MWFSSLLTYCWGTLGLAWLPLSTTCVPIFQIHSKSASQAVVLTVADWLSCYYKATTLYLSTINCYLGCAMGKQSLIWLNLNFSLFWMPGTYQCRLYRRVVRWMELGQDLRYGPITNWWHAASRGQLWPFVGISFEDHCKPVDIFNLTAINFPLRIHPRSTLACKAMGWGCRLPSCQNDHSAFRDMQEADNNIMPVLSSDKASSQSSSVL